MKGRNRSKIPGLVGLFAIIIFMAGVLSGFRVFQLYEQQIAPLSHHETLFGVFRDTAVSSMISGSLIVLGIGLLLMLFLDMLRRTNRILRETEALRQKNQAREELNRQTQKLAHHQRLEIIGTLTSSIAHEFNNLLTPIMGNSLLAMEQLTSDEGELYEELLEIYSASCKAKEIISRLSDLSRKNSPNTFRTASLDVLIQKALTVATPAKPKEVEIRLNLNCWDQRIRVNEIQITQMLLNLILNAFDAIGETGVLSVDTTFDDRAVNLRVTDDGCGIPEPLQHKVFDPFFTTKESGKGTGLGLAIVAQVVEDHNGTIQIESKPGEGTCFKISLPRVDEID